MNRYLEISMWLWQYADRVCKACYDSLSPEELDDYYTCRIEAGYRDNCEPYSWPTTTSWEGDDTVGWTEVAVQKARTYAGGASDDYAITQSFTSFCERLSKSEDACTAFVCLNWCDKTSW